MQSFNLLYFHDNVLEHVEAIHVRDVLEAIEATSGKPSHLRVEVWSERGRVAEIGLSPVVRHRSK